MINQVLQSASMAAEVAPKLKKLEEATKGIESMFMKDLLAAMRRGTPETGFGNSYGSKMYRDMFDQTLADGLGKTGSLGIAKILYKQLSKQVMAQARQAE